MLRKAEIIAVGTEVAQGEITNTNASLIARELTLLGLSVQFHTVVVDHAEDIASALGRGIKRSDVIVVTGGLGPTCDDLTREGAAHCAGVPLVYHPECEAQIRTYYRMKLHGREMPDENLRQAFLPEGSEVLKNDWGTAPGFLLQIENCKIFALPGVPRECESMLHFRVIPWLQEHIGNERVKVRTLRIFGLGESEVDTLLRDYMLELKNPSLAPYAKNGEVELRMTARAGNSNTADMLLDKLEMDIRKVLGDVIYGRDVESIESVIVPLLKQKGLTVATGESCTGGWIAKRITDIPGASVVLKGGIVAYTNEAKHNLLRVSKNLLLEHGAVSAETACAMAAGAKEVLRSDLAVSVTGLAGPETDEYGHKGGTVFLALTDGTQTWVKEAHLGTDRRRVRIMTAHTALDMIRRYLTGMNVV